MMISYDGWCRPARQAGLSPNRQLRVGEPARPNHTLALLMPDPTILWLYSYPTHARPNYTLALLMPD